MATVYIIWDREKKAALPGSFPSASDATAHTNRLASREGRSGRVPTRDVVAVTV